jgi:threonine synthase
LHRRAGGNLGNGTAIGKGLRELKALSLLEKVPGLIVVQAAGANPFYRMLAKGSAELAPEKNPSTEATAIRIGNPANWKKARRTLEWTGGICESVADGEIFHAKAALAQDGVGCEPASAASVAGVRKLRQQGRIEPGTDVVAILTGSQLKDPDYILRHGGQASAAGRRIRSC